MQSSFLLVHKDTQRYFSEEELSEVLRGTQKSTQSRNEGENLSNKAPEATSDPKLVTSCHHTTTTCLFEQEFMSFLFISLLLQLFNRLLPERKMRWTSLPHIVVNIPSIRNCKLI